MKKILLMVTMLLILCGCSNEYNLTIKDGKFIEDINMVIPKSMIPDIPDVDSEYYIESDDRITPFINNEQYAYDDEAYEKTVTEDNENYYVNLKYEYDAETFEKGQALTCFENVTFENGKDYYYIELSGRFYCLYGNEATINISVDGDKVEENNSIKNNKNTYTWIINNDNVKDANISIRISKVDKVEKYTMIFLIIAGIVIVIGFSFAIYKIVANKEKLNEV